MDEIFLRFLQNTAGEAAALQAKSDILRLEARDPFPSSRYDCTFLVPYVRRLARGTVEIDPGPVDTFIRFPEDYLWSTDPALYLNMAAVLSPDFLHPNVQAGGVCLGVGFAPGTPLTGVVWQLFQIVTYRNYTVYERNALNAEACRLVRAHPGLLEQLPQPRLYRPRRAARSMEAIT
jgi:hypothetical protein